MTTTIAMTTSTRPKLTLASKLINLISHELENLSDIELMQLQTEIGKEAIYRSTKGGAA
jgi:hypothetical protein